VTAKPPLNVAKARRIRIGVVAFPISGIVGAGAAFVPGIGINPALDPAGFANEANYVGLANLVGILGLVFLLFGFQALRSFFETSSVNQRAIRGMILSIIGTALFLPFLGIIAFAGPVAGKLYLSGQLQAINIISEATGPSNPTVLVFGGLSVISSILGAILFSLAMWRSNTLPKWSAIAYAISAPLNWTPHYIPALWLIGGILLFGAGIGMTRGIWLALRTDSLDP
jgi:hypothetical protein